MKKTAQQIRQEIGIYSPKGLSEANYNYESYQSNIIREQDDFIEFLVDKLNIPREDLENEFDKLS